jgi:hypothetical protein
MISRDVFLRSMRLGHAKSSKLVELPPIPACRFFSNGVVARAKPSALEAGRRRQPGSGFVNS